MILPLEKQVVSLELAKRLKELGAPQDSLFVYRHWRGCGQVIVDKKKEKYFDYPHYRKIKPQTSVICAAYTVAELGELLRNGRVPMSISREEDKLRRWLCTSYRTNISTTFNADTEADARALCLIDALEGDTPEKIKERKAFLKYFLKLCI